MPDDSHLSDADIIRAAYAERVKEAFKVYAENIGMGQNQKASTERFLRSLELVRKARDMALEAMNGVAIVEPTAFAASDEADDSVASEPLQLTANGLSAADQALIDQALSGTTGQKPLARG